MSSPVAIVVDSTADLPKHIADERRIYVVPEYILWGTESFRDGVDLEPEPFYWRLKTDPVIPKTSQPSPADFLKAFQTAVEETKAESVICLCLSADLSGTYNSAMQAKEQADFPVRVIDSRNASMPLAFLALTAADGRDGGRSATEIERYIRSSLPKTNILFTVSSLEYLHRGGRIGGAQRLIGDTLKIKPILTVIDGKVAARESVRTQKRVVQRMIDLIDEIRQGQEIWRLGVMHGMIPDEAKALLDQIQERYHPDTLLINNAGPAVATHVGPGCLGIAYQFK